MPKNGYNQKAYDVRAYDKAKKKIREARGEIIKQVKEAYDKAVKRKGV